ncbi:MAG: glycosyltransferase family 2 protein [Desulfobulbaceae bacterium]|nr:glycosyltransferase family 2 protein [Desulfobulbaceae bacterium]
MQKTSLPEVSIIIVNWNGRDLLEDCFQSLSRQIYSDFEVIFIDNASSDNSVALAKKLAGNLNFPFNLVALPSNTGFTGGNIEGLKHCQGRYIALLNNDTIVSDVWLESLVKAMEGHPKVGICASKIIVAGTDMLDSAGEILWSNLRTARRGLGLPSSSYTRMEYVFGAPGAAVLYRGQMLDEIGFLDPDFFLYYEDSDLNFRAQLAGWKCLFVPDAVVQHKVNASAVNLWDIAEFKILKNDKITIIKNAPFLLLLKHLPLYLLEEIVFSVYYHIRAHRFNKYLRGISQFFKEFPRHLRKRRQVMEIKKVSTSYIESIMTPIGPQYRYKFQNRFKSLMKSRENPDA